MLRTVLGERDYSYNSQINQLPEFEVAAMMIYIFGEATRYPYPFAQQISPLCLTGMIDECSYSKYLHG
jgi:hypothetical protein